MNNLILSLVIVIIIILVLVVILENPSVVGLAKD